MTTKDSRPAGFVTQFFPVFLLLLSLDLLAQGYQVPADEAALQDKIDLQAVTNDTTDISGVWGKCLKSVDTRCYYMAIDTEGLTSILTYISKRDTQFGEDPADKPHCYNKTDRALARLGEYTYIWEEDLASGTDFNASAFLKILIKDRTMLVFKGGKLELSLPEVTEEDISGISIC